jgi:formylglycine-generating enzyme required for sulfatase activity
VIWHQLLTGDLTSPAPTGRRWADELRQQGTSDAALDLLSSCFETNPAHRPDDAVALAEGLEAILSSRAKKNDASRLAAPPVETKTPASVETPPPRTATPHAVPAPRSIEPGIAPAVASQRSDPDFITTDTGRIKLKLIPAGEFTMGSDEGQGGSEEHPRHGVTITRPFYLGVYELTQDQFKELMGHNPSYFSSNGAGKNKIAGASTGAHPVESVSWLDAVLFCNKLSEKEGLKPFYQIAGKTATVLSWSGDGYRLPTEAEWEYASGGDPEDLGGSAWHLQNSGGETHPVGQKQENQLGLYDMLGNVWEWCWDMYDEGYYKLSPSEDPCGPSVAMYRAFRGGGWSLNPRDCRSALRSRNAPGSRNDYLGFRVARGQSQR